MQRQDILVNCILGFLDVATQSVGLNGIWLSLDQLLLQIPKSGVRYQCEIVDFKQNEIVDKLSESARSYLIAPFLTAMNSIDTELDFDDMALGRMEFYSLFELYQPINFTDFLNDKKIEADLTNVLLAIRKVLENISLDESTQLEEFVKYIAHREFIVEIRRYLRLYTQNISAIIRKHIENTSCKTEELVQSFGVGAQEITAFKQVLYKLAQKIFDNSFE